MDADFPGTEALRAQELLALTVHAGEVPLGRLTDLLLDDRVAGVRHLRVRTGSWLNGRQRFLPAARVASVDRRLGRLHLDLALDEIHGSPAGPVPEPRGRPFLATLHRRFGFGPRGGGPLRHGLDALPPPGRPVLPVAPVAARLLGRNELLGIVACDAERPIGHVVDLLVDLSQWRLAAVVVHSSRWWRGRTFLVSAERIAGVDMTTRRLLLHAGAERGLHMEAMGG